MSGEYDKCGDHTLECCCMKGGDKVSISKMDLIDLIHWARRYCDGRSTHVPHSFNEIYKRLRIDHADLFRCRDRFDKGLMDEGAYWPYAQDGMYNKEKGKMDARYGMDQSYFRN